MTDEICSQHRQYHLGLAWSELNTILRRIRLRPDNEPTPAEMIRIRDLRDKIKELKHG